MLTRRQLLKRGAAGAGGLMLANVLLQRSVLAASSVANGLTRFVDPMPTLLDNLIDATGTTGATYDVTAQLVTRSVHSQLPAARFFGYTWAGGPPPTGAPDNSVYLGPTFLARKGIGVNVNYHNNLPAAAYLDVFTNNGSSYLQFPPHQETRILAHLHGGFVAGKDDGNPYQNYDAIPSLGTQSVVYPNEDVATLLWYHDHYLGDTRMNVVGGLAAGYLVRDSEDTGAGSLGLPHNLSGGGLYELPLVIQDRQWNADGSLLYPVNPTTLNGPWIGEYFGDTMLVNGKIWPYLVVDPCLYRFRVINGCNARILNLNIPGAKMTVIGSELGLFQAPVTGLNKLVMAPAERFDVIVDFSGIAGKTVTMKNSNPPNPVVTPAPSLTPVMQIRVNPRIMGGGQRTWPGVLPAWAAGRDLRAMGAPKLSGGSVPGRSVVLNEVSPATEDWILNLNGKAFDGRGNTTRQTLQHNAVEDWYFVNTTADTHPMHTHLFSFQVLGRYNLDTARFIAAATAAGFASSDDSIQQVPISFLTPYLKSGLIPHDPEEPGFKDTVKANPGQVTVVRAKYELPSTALNPDGSVAGGQQDYVYHCHIVEHEDNDMMERTAVVDTAAPPEQ